MTRNQLRARAEGAVSHQASRDFFPALHQAGGKLLICCLRAASSWTHCVVWVGPCEQLGGLKSGFFLFSDPNVYRNQAENKVRQEPSRGAVLLLSFLLFELWLQCCVTFRGTVQ